MSDMDVFDTGEGGAAAPPATLASIRKLAERTRDLEEVCDTLETELKHKKAALFALKTKALPDAMSEIGFKTFTLEDGTEVKIGDVVSGSLPKDEERKSKALFWLEQNEGASLIKGRVELLFGKGEENQAIKLVAQLRKRGFEVHYDRTVHPQTLAAFARELLRDGQDVPFEMLGLYTGKLAKFELPKEHKNENRG